jgi:hypothetical protein
MSVISMLKDLHVLPIWCDIGLNTVIQYARLVSHLKEDILLPQPVDQSNIDEPPEILELEEWSPAQDESEQQDTPVVRSS